MTDILMPNLEFDTHSGRVVRWLKQPGETVKKGEAIAVVESNRTHAELESTTSGVVVNRMVEVGTEVAVGAVIARVVAPDDPAMLATIMTGGKGEGEDGDADTPGTDSRRTMLSPVAQRLVIQHGIDLEQLQGTGTSGRITRHDPERHLPTSTGQSPTIKKTTELLTGANVRRTTDEVEISLEDVLVGGAGNPIRLADLQDLRIHTGTIEAADSTPIEPLADAPPPPSKSDTAEIKLSRIRQTTGKRLSESMREAPHFYVTGEFDLEDALRKLELFPPPQPRLNDLVQYLTVQTLVKVPELNATYAELRLNQHTDVNLAIAVALNEGQITPVIPKAQHYSLPGLATASHDLIHRARENSLQAQDLSTGTFTISNLGIISQVDHFTAVINPPQVGILAVGAIKQRPVVRQGGLHVRHTVHLTLSGDHRVVDGMSLGRFMAAFQSELDYFSR